MTPGTELHYVMRQLILFLTVDIFKGLALILSPEKCIPYSK